MDKLDKDLKILLEKRDKLTNQLFLLEQQQDLLAKQKLKISFCDQIKQYFQEYFLSKRI